ncbi:OmpP1/FadL family transporter [Phyllobacterium myrsinacearum]|uniref:Long-chain fatty acid transport protein n=1 Tax=Phyllobacterium myrsinacearum TaxID=28101 RepID=A0A839EW92_9HYPH|nr:OmpP1/FadL family transporter [Phyllobacterium myrsinacearum]MBA8880800.1 long-chain fatty acid transport protein [Phyllobacterium myrsinacearum]
MTKTISTIIGGALLLTGVATAAQAGGLERGGYNWDLLFSEERFATEGGVIYVMPDRKIKNAKDTDPRDGNNNNKKSTASETPDYSVYKFGAKVGITPDLDCLGTYSQPWGVHTKPGNNWAGVNQNIETKVKSEDWGLTCSYKFNVGEKGDFRIIGGVSYQEVSGFKERQVHPGFPGRFDGTGRLDLEGNGVGWRIGAAYEIPEIALRASLIYNSEVDLGTVTGTLDLTQSPLAPGIGGRITDVYGTATMPQSVEFKLQSGFAPGWLAYGSVKWVDWSVLNVIAFCPTATQGKIACGPASPARATSLDLMFQDGWTVTGGVGHKFNDQWSGQLQVSWDRGTSTGLTTQTDTYLLSGGVAYSPNKNVEIRLGGAIGMLTSGSYGPTACPNAAKKCGTDATYDFGDDLVTAVSLSGKLKF